MNRRERLQETYEEALFALLMEDIMEEEGKKLVEENERLKNDPQAAVPDEMRNRCLKTIRREFNKGRRQKVGKAAYRAVSKIAVVSLLCILLFSVAFATSPKLRTKTLNLMIEISEVGTSLILGEDNGDCNTADDPEAGELIYSTFGYRLPRIPDGFALTEKAINSSGATLFYDNEDGRTICLTFQNAAGTTFVVDTEKAQRAESIFVSDFEGMLIQKENIINIVWADSERSVFISVSGLNVDETTLWSVASSICSG